MSCAETPLTFRVTGVWKDGRVGTYRGIRPGGGEQQFGGMVFGSEGIGSVRDGGEDEVLMRELVKFFKTGKPAVSAEETIEIFAVMDAAEESIHQGAKPVSVAEVIEKAQKGAAAKFKELARP